MERNRVTGAIAIVLLLGVAACSGQDDAANAALDDSTAVAVPAAPTGMPDTTMPAAPPVEGGATLTVANSPEYGSYLADGQGRALYLFTSDKAGESSCTDACAQAWPPYVTAQGTPTAGSAEVQASLISTVQRADGSTQVVYN
ncbi:MAG TPA: hypothetical protein VFI96_05000, partial [Longimicrobiaceae bacterium]|nr:hypothetical protein [Longimicrobiaceae bacterium]